jgi:hypothetical protein
MLPKNRYGIEPIVMRRCGQLSEPSRYRQRASKIIFVLTIANLRLVGKRTRAAEAAAQVSVGLLAGGASLYCENT